jgi:CRP-like cAMP-binding protein
MDDIYAEEKMSGKSLVEVLRKVELFKSFSEETLHVLAEHSKQIWLQDQDVLCKEGDPGDKMWVVVSGRVMVFKLKKTIAWRNVFDRQSPSLCFNKGYRQCSSVGNQ